MTTDFIINVFLGYITINVGTYLISIFYTIVLRTKNRSIGHWFFENNKVDKPKTILWQQVITPILIFIAFLPIVLLVNVERQIQDEKHTSELNEKEI